MLTIKRATNQIFSFRWAERQRAKPFQIIDHIITAMTTPGLSCESVESSVGIIVLKRFFCI